MRQKKKQFLQKMVSNNPSIITLCFSMCSIYVFNFSYDIYIITCKISTFPKYERYYSSINAPSIKPSLFYIQTCNKALYFKKDNTSIKYHISFQLEDKTFLFLFFCRENIPLTSIEFQFLLKIRTLNNSGKD